MVERIRPRHARGALVLEPQSFDRAQRRLGHRRARRFPRKGSGGRASRKSTSDRRGFRRFRAFRLGIGSAARSRQSSTALL